MIQQHTAGKYTLIFIYFMYEYWNPSQYSSIQVERINTFLNR